MVDMIFICKSIPLSTKFFVSMIFNHSSTEFLISCESVVQQVTLFYQYLVHLHGDFHRKKGSNKNLANSTMKKRKNSVPIVEFFELLLLFPSGLCSTCTVLEPVLFERSHQLLL